MSVEINRLIFEPLCGFVTGGAPLYIHGDNFSQSDHIFVIFKGDGYQRVAKCVFVNTKTCYCAVPAVERVGDAELNIKFQNNDPVSIGKSYYFFRPLCISKLTPKSGLVTGGNEVNISLWNPDWEGKSFSVYSKLSRLYETIKIKFTSLEEKSDFSVVVGELVQDSKSVNLRCTVPAMKKGMTQVTVALNGKQFTEDEHKEYPFLESDQYLFYDPPVVQFISPGCGPVLESSVVSFQGREFIDTKEISIRFARKEKGMRCSEDAFMGTVSADFVSPTEIQCSTPARFAEGEFSIEISLNNGYTFTPTGQSYIFFHCPIFSTLSPVVGSHLGGTPLRITAFLQCNTPYHGVIPVSLNSSDSYFRDTGDIRVQFIAFNPRTLANQREWMLQQSDFSTDHESYETSKLLADALIDDSLAKTTTYTEGYCGTLIGQVKGWIDEEGRICCNTPLNLNIESFQTRSFEEVHVSIAIDGRKYLGDLMYKYYVEPRLLALSALSGPCTGGSELILTMAEGVVNTNQFFVKFSSPDQSVVVPASCCEVKRGLVTKISCQTPPWSVQSTTEVHEETLFFDSVVTISLNGVDFSGGIWYHGIDKLKKNADDQDPFISSKARLDSDAGIKDLKYSFFSVPCITRVHPEGGPIEGGTKLLFYGRHLTHHQKYDPNIQVVFSDDSATCVAVKGMICDSSDAFYCTTPTFSFKPGRLHLQVIVNNCEANFMCAGQYELRVDGQNRPLQYSLPLFSIYKSPAVTHIRPECAPMLGGTSIDVYGRGLSATGRIFLKFCVESQQEVVEGTVISDVCAECTSPSFFCAGNGHIYVSLNNEDYMTEPTSVHGFCVYERPVLADVTPKHVIANQNVSLCLRMKSAIPMSTLQARFAYATDKGVSPASDIEKLKIWPEADGIIGLLLELDPLPTTSPSIDRERRQNLDTSIANHELMLELAFDGHNFSPIGNLLSFITLHPAPLISSLSPRRAPSCGGCELVVCGSGFISSDEGTIRFQSGDYSVTSQYRYVNAETVKCVIPAWEAITPSRVLVKVSLNSKQYPKQAASFQFFEMPIITALNPPIGPCNVKDVVTIEGGPFPTCDCPQSLQLLPPSCSCFQVRFGTTVVPARVVDSQHVVCQAPSFSLNRGEVISFVPIALSFNNQFTSEDILSTFSKRAMSQRIVSGTSYEFGFYRDPTFFQDCLSARDGPSTGGTCLTISGNGFIRTENNRCWVKFFDIHTEQVVSGVVVDENSITCSTPPFHECDRCSIALSFNDLDFHEIIDTFHFYTNPCIKSVTPSSAPTSGGISVVMAIRDPMNGDWMRSIRKNGCRVKMGIPESECGDYSSRLISKGRMTADSIEFTLPVLPIVGVFPLLFSLNGGVDFADCGHPFQLYNPPSLLRIEPVLGPRRGGTLITISGKNLVETGNVFVKFFWRINSHVVGSPREREMWKVKRGWIEQGRIKCYSPRCAGEPYEEVAYITVSLNGQQYCGEPAAFRYYVDPVPRFVYPCAAPINCVTRVCLSDSHIDGIDPRKLSISNSKLKFHRISPSSATTVYPMDLKSLKPLFGPVRDEFLISHQPLNDFLSEYPACNVRFRWSDRSTIESRGWITPVGIVFEIVSSLSVDYSIEISLNQQQYISIDCSFRFFVPHAYLSRHCCLLNEVSEIELCGDEAFQEALGLSDGSLPIITFVMYRQLKQPGMEDDPTMLTPPSSPVSLPPNEWQKCLRDSFVSTSMTFAAKLVIDDSIIFDCPIMSQPCNAVVIAEVSTSGGKKRFWSSDVFTYYPSVAISKFAPQWVPLEFGTRVLVSGTSIRHTDQLVLRIEAVGWMKDLKCSMITEGFDDDDLNVFVDDLSDEEALIKCLSRIESGRIGSFSCDVPFVPHAIMKHLDSIPWSEYPDALESLCCKLSISRDNGFSFSPLPSSTPLQFYKTPFLSGLNPACLLSSGHLVSALHDEDIEKTGFDRKIIAGLQTNSPPQLVLRGRGLVSSFSTKMRMRFFGSTKPSVFYKINLHRSKDEIATDAYYQVIDKKDVCGCELGEDSSLADTKCDRPSCSSSMSPIRTSLSLQARTQSSTWFSTRASLSPRPYPTEQFSCKLPQFTSTCLMRPSSATCGRSSVRSDISSRGAPGSRIDFVNGLIVDHSTTHAPVRDEERRQWLKIMSEMSPLALTASEAPSHQYTKLVETDCVWSEGRYATEINDELDEGWWEAQVALNGQDYSPNGCDVCVYSEPEYVDLLPSYVSQQGGTILSICYQNGVRTRKGYIRLIPRRSEQSIILLEAKLTVATKYTLDHRTSKTVLNAFRVDETSLNQDLPLGCMIWVELPSVKESGDYLVQYGFDGYNYFPDIGSLITEISASDGNHPLLLHFFDPGAWVIDTIAPECACMSNPTSVSIQGNNFRPIDGVIQLDLVEPANQLASNEIEPIKVPCVIESERSITFVTPKPPTPGRYNVSIVILNGSHQIPCGSIVFYDPPQRLQFDPPILPAGMSNSLLMIKGQGLIKSKTAICLFKVSSASSESDGKLTNAMKDGVASPEKKLGSDAHMCPAVWNESAMCYECHPPSHYLHGILEISISLDGVYYSSISSKLFCYDVSTLDPNSGPVSGGTIVAVSFINLPRTINEFCVVENEIGVDDKWETFLEIFQRYRRLLISAQGQIDYIEPLFRFNWIENGELYSADVVGECSWGLEGVASSGWICRLSCPEAPQLIKAAAFDCYLQVSLDGGWNFGGTNIQKIQMDPSCTDDALKFRYFVEPELQSISPISGMLAGGSKVTLHGAHFPQSAQILVRFDSHWCTRLISGTMNADGTEIVCETPTWQSLCPRSSSDTGVGSRSSEEKSREESLPIQETGGCCVVHVTFNGQQFTSGLHPIIYIFQPNPELTRSVPHFGAIGGQTRVELQGNNMISGCGLELHISFTPIDDQQLSSLVTPEVARTIKPKTVVVPVTVPVESDLALLMKAYHEEATERWPSITSDPSLSSEESLAKQIEFLKDITGKIEDVLCHPAVHSVAYSSTVPLPKYYERVAVLSVCLATEAYSGYEIEFEYKKLPELISWNISGAETFGGDLLVMQGTDIFDTGNVYVRFTPKRFLSTSEFPSHERIAEEQEDENGEEQTGASGELHIGIPASREIQLTNMSHNTPRHLGWRRPQHKRYDTSLINQGVIVPVVVPAKYVGVNIGCVTPRLPFPCEVDVQLTLNNEDYGPPSPGFTYYPSPIIESISPICSRLEGDPEVFIAGRNFLPGQSIVVYFKDTEGNLLKSTEGKCSSSTQLVCSVPSWPSSGFCIVYALMHAGPTDSSIEAFGLDKDELNMMKSKQHEHNEELGQMFQFYKSPSIERIEPHYEGLYTNVVKIVGLFEDTQLVTVKYIIVRERLVLNDPLDLTRRHSELYCDRSTEQCKTPQFDEGFITCAGPDCASGETIQVEITMNGRDWIVGPTFIHHPKPRLISVSPKCGGCCGGTDLAITGDCFIEGMHVKVSLMKCIASATSVGAKTMVFDGVVEGKVIRCVTPPCPVEDDDEVTLPYKLDVDLYANGTNIGPALDFFYVQGTPFVSKLYPLDGPVFGSNTLTITGGMFVDTNHIVVRFLDSEDGCVYVPGNFVNSNTVRTVVPKLKVPGNILVSVALNGQDYTSHSTFTTYRAWANWSTRNKRIEAEIPMENVAQRYIWPQRRVVSPRSNDKRVIAREEERRNVIRTLRSMNWVRLNGESDDCTPSVPPYLYTLLVTLFSSPKQRPVFIERMKDLFHYHGSSSQTIRFPEFAEGLLSLFVSNAYPQQMLDLWFYLDNHGCNQLMIQQIYERLEEGLSPDLVEELNEDLRHGRSPSPPMRLSSMKLPLRSVSGMSATRKKEAEAELVRRPMRSVRSKRLQPLRRSPISVDLASTVPVTPVSPPSDVEELSSTVTLESLYTPKTPEKPRNTVRKKLSTRRIVKNPKL